MQLFEEILKAHCKAELLNPIKRIEHYKVNCLFISVEADDKLIVSTAFYSKSRNHFHNKDYKTIDFHIAGTSVGNFIELHESGWMSIVQ